MANVPNAPRPADPDRPIDRLLQPITRFLRVEASAGILLLLCTAAALIWANSPWSESYDHFWHTYLKVGFGEHSLKLSLAHFVNDGLMAIFFFVVGLEIKREFLVGELATRTKATLPIVAAVGGMAAPALVYVAFNLGGAGIRGWAIPAATDIAFAVGVMALLGKRVPLSIKVFVTALAIADDIGAVLIIAIFYTSEISMVALITANLLLVGSFIANRLHVRSAMVYGLIGLAMWLMLLQSGVHATIGGVLLALTIPSRVRIDGAQFVSFARESIRIFEREGGNVDEIMTQPVRQAAVNGLEDACEHVLTPLNRLEHGLHPWVAFVIMPVFALANAGVHLGEGLGEAATSPVTLGVALGLFLGKPVGILLATWIAVAAGIAVIPNGVTRRQLVGASCLAGIGFTMSLFIANLAFKVEGVDADSAAAMMELNTMAKVGILVGSALAGIAGFVLLRSGPDPAAAPAADHAPNGPAA